MFIVLNRVLLQARTRWVLVLVSWSHIVALLLFPTVGCCICCMKASCFIAKILIDALHFVWFTFNLSGAKGGVTSYLHKC